MGCTTSSQWVNGNLNGNQAHYLEGDSVAYRLRFDNLAIGPTHTVTIEWDTTKSGKHALDYLTTYNRTVATADPCQGVAGCNSASFNAEAIPVDPMLIPGNGFSGTQIAGEFRLYNGSLGTLSAYTVSGLYSGDSSTRITISFTATAATPVLAWGAHIATRLSWGAGNSAVAISSSPYHMRLIDIDGKGGNQDRSLSSDAVIFPAKVTITKNTVGGSDGTFGFTSANQTLPNPDPQNGVSGTGASFSIATSGGTNSAVFSNILVSSGTTTFTVTKTSPTSGFIFSTLACNDPTTDTTISGATATIKVSEGEEITCTYTNTATTKIVIVKNTNGGNGTFTYTVSGGAPLAAFTLTTAANTASQTFTNVPPGTYTVTETAQTGWQLDTLSCSDPTSDSTTSSATATIKVAAGETVTCTFGNSKQGTVTIVKNTVGDNGTFGYSGGLGSFSLTTSGGTAQTVFTNVPPGTYTVTEATQTGWDATGLSCTDPTSDSSGDATHTIATIKVAAGESVSCTYTNKARFTIIVLVCREADSSLHSSSVTIGGDTKNSLGSTSTLGGLSQADICGLGGARFTGYEPGASPSATIDITGSEALPIP